MGHISVLVGVSENIHLNRSSSLGNIVVGGEGGGGADEEKGVGELHFDVLFGEEIGFRSCRSEVMTFYSDVLEVVDGNAFAAITLEKRKPMDEQ